MCEEHSVIVILRREEFPKYLNREKENWQFVFLPSSYLDQLSCVFLPTEIWAAWGRAYDIQAFGLAVKNPYQAKLSVGVDPRKLWVWPHLCALTFDFVSRVGFGIH